MPRPLHGPTFEYHFNSANELSVRVGGGNAIEAGYGALQPKHLVLVSHLMPGSQTGYHLVVDQHTKLTIVVETWFSGYVKLQEGKGIHWKPDHGVATSVFYSSVIFSNFLALTRSGGKLTHCGPSDHLMIDEHTFIYTRVEAEFAGFGCHVGPSSVAHPVGAGAAILQCGAGRRTRHSTATLRRASGCDTGTVVAWLTTRAPTAGRTAARCHAGRL